MTDETFIAITPFGQVSIAFDEEAGNTMTGDPDAIAHLADVMSRCTGPLGASITPQNLEPNTLVHFCQPPGAMVVIVPPPGFVMDDADADAGEDATVLDSAEQPALARLRESAAVLARLRESQG